MTIADENDWRRQGQEKYLLDRMLIRRTYSPYRVDWDHDHCEFCFSKFSLAEQNLHEGFSTEDGYHWICEKCFEDFKEEFNWQTQTAPPNPKGNKQ